MTIYEIKERTQKSAPYFFTKNALKFFGQTMQSFKIHKIDAEHYEITAPMKDKDGRNMGTTRRVFNAITNELETTRHD